MKEYKIVYDRDTKQFEKKVNMQLIHGFELYGNPFITESENEGIKTQYYNQALVKE